MFCDAIVLSSPLFYFMNQDLSELGKNWFSISDCPDLHQTETANNIWNKYIQCILIAMKHRTDIQLSLDFCN